MANDRNRLVLQALEAESALRARLTREGYGRQDMDDIAQDVYLRMLESSSMPETVDSIEAYMSRLGRNIAIDRVRHEKCVAEHQSASTASRYPIDAVDRPDDELAARQLLSQAFRAFKTLPLLTRKVLWRRKIRGQSQPQIAQALGITVDAVESRLNKGKEQLERALMQVLPPDEGRSLMTRIWKRRRSHEDAD